MEDRITIVKTFIKIALITTVFLFIAQDLIKSSREIPIQFDEYIYVSRSRFFDLYKKFDWLNKQFLTQSSYDSLKLPEYIYGLTLNLDGHNDIKSYLTNVNFNKDSYAVDYPPEWFWKADAKGVSISHLSKDVQARIEPILIARQASLIFTILSLFTLFYIGCLLKDWLTGVISVIIFSFNPLFKITMLKAMQEPILIFLFLIYFIMSIRFFKDLRKGKISLKKIIFLGILSGFLLSVKPTGIVCSFYLIIAFSIILYVVRSIKFKTSKFILSILIYLLTGLIIFVILNPFTLFDLSHNVKFMADYQYKSRYVIKYEDYPKQALESIQSRVLKVFERTMVPNGYYTSFSINIGIGNFQFNMIPLDIIFFIVGLMLLLKKTISNNNNYGIIFFIWVITIIISISLLIPMDWDRYYLPVILPVGFIESLSIYYLFNKLFIMSKKKINNS